MKKIFAISIIIALLTVTTCFADEGETESAPCAAPNTVSQQVFAPAPPRPMIAPVWAPAAAMQAPAGGRIIREVTLENTDPSFVTGIVIEVFPSCLARPTSRIIIAGEDSREIEFSVRPLAVIYDSDGTIFALDQLSSGQTVQVNYRVRKDGTKEATSIKIIS